MGPGRTADGDGRTCGGAVMALTPAGHSPVVVLATAYSGAGQLRSLLDRHADLACTAGTGMLPLCEQAMAVWRSAEGRRGASPSGLALTSTRALTDTVITSVLAREGKRRWCEVVSAVPDIAEGFLQLYPRARFLCLYRACPGFIRATLDASPWGIADAVFAPFARAYPASTVAALSAYWVAFTGSLLAFERSHPEAALRIRFEDLAAAEHSTERAVLSFLSVTSIDGGEALALDSETEPEPENPDPDADVPVGLIPPAMLAQANELLSELGYAALPWE
jgi:protein-tyrosine sulfotransferase